MIRRIPFQLLPFAYPSFFTRIFQDDTGSQKRKHRASWSDFMILCYWPWSHYVHFIVVLPQFSIDHSTVVNHLHCLVLCFALFFFTQLALNSNKMIQIQLHGSRFNKSHPFEHLIYLTTSVTWARRNGGASFRLQGQVSVTLLTASQGKKSCFLSSSSWP